MIIGLRPKNLAIVLVLVLMAALVLMPKAPTTEGGVEHEKKLEPSLQGDNVSINIYSNVKRRKAAIYARPTFHEEVVSTIACMLHDEGFHVSVYIGSGLAIGRLNVPFSEKRKRKAVNFYGHCVDSWITITDPLVKSAYIRNLDLLIFSTYPILEHNFVRDDVAMSLIADAGLAAKDTSVVFITHRTEETLHEQLNVIEKHIPRSRFTFTFLSEHTALTMASLLKEKGLNYVRVKPTGDEVSHDVGKGEPYRLAHFFPIMSMEHAQGGPKRASWWSSASASASTPSQSQSHGPGGGAERVFEHGQVFSIQGNFGGRHAHRKDIKGTVSCLRGLEEEDSKFGGGKAVHLDLIGHVVGGRNSLDTGTLKRGKVNIIADLSSTDYYSAIADTHFMIVAVAEKDYYCCRATSSVPAALITGTPLVAQRSFLKYYPCLNEAPVHKLIAKDTECESIEAAHKLTKEQYLQARQEMANCSAIFYSEARDLWRYLASKPWRSLV